MKGEKNNGSKMEKGIFADSGCAYGSDLLRTASICGTTAIESTWKTAATQIKTVTNNVIFPVVDCVLAILLFVKLAMAYFDYKKHGEFDFAPVAILFFGLVFAITAPTYIWNILGI